MQTIQFIFYYYFVCKKYQVRRNCYKKSESLAFYGTFEGTKCVKKNPNYRKLMSFIVHVAGNLGVALVTGKRCSHSPTDEDQSHVFIFMSCFIRYTDTRGRVNSALHCNHMNYDDDSHT